MYPSKKLSEICDLQNGFAFKSSDYVDFSNTLNFRMSNIRPGGGLDIEHNITYLADNFSKIYSNFLLEDGDIVIAMTDMAKDPKILAIPTIIRTDSRLLLMNQRVGRFKNIDFGLITKPYLRWVLLSPRIREKLVSMGGGGVQINISTKQILSLEIPLPPLSTQSRIVARLDSAFASIDEQISLLRANIADVKNMRKSVLEESFQNGKYEMKELGKIIRLNYGKAVDKSDKSDDGLYDVYGANGVMYKSKRFNFDGESIIVGRKGSAGAINRVSGKFWASDVTYYVTTDQNIDYICYILKKLNLPELAKGVKPGINRNDVYEIEIPLPPLPRQYEIVAHLDRVFATTEVLRGEYEAQIRDLEILKQSLLEEAFAGRLVTD